mmetsp:Transcript_15632/g.32998  ORF Transcript_15632/g.32998 Transcript_15632/m.32998 type:complete len:303 (-) Transcript_15632:409-1317(-)
MLASRKAFPTIICHGGQLQSAIRGTLIRSASSSHVVPSDDNIPPSSPSSTFDFEAIRNELTNAWISAEASSPRGRVTTARYCCFTHHDAQRAYLDPSARWHWLDREMSSNLAGETGAVFIYRGALAALALRPAAATGVRNRNRTNQQHHEDVLEFCASHMKNESSHLEMFRCIVPEGKRTRLLPVWKMAGFGLGFVPTLVGGSRALYVTVEAVETFVEEHFREQIVRLKREKGCPNLVRLLEHCCEDEVHHREDAARRLLGMNAEELGEKKLGGGLDAFWVRPWTAVVKRGSAIAAAIARRI